GNFDHAKVVIKGGIVGVTISHDRKIVAEGSQPLSDRLDLGAVATLGEDGVPGWVENAHGRVAVAIGLDQAHYEHVITCTCEAVSIHIPQVDPAGRDLAKRDRLQPVGWFALVDSASDLREA